MNSIQRINQSSSTRLLIALLSGVIAALISFTIQAGILSVLIGWEIAVIVFILWIWLIIWPMDHQRTAEFAQHEDPGRVGVDILLILASIASLGAVGYALFEAHTSHNSGNGLIITLISLLSVVVSWVLIHTIYSLRYARFYFSKEINGSIDFNGGHKPAYSDFIYVAFTIGMTYQIADTSVSGTGFRKIVLRHAILSYVFGTVIVATTISLIAGLGS